ncbi:MAG: GGDEF domain-containing protein [Inhella sp.]
MPTLLKNLGAMTAIRDTYVVEQSLLRTLGPLLGVTHATLHRVDENQRVVRTLQHTRQISADRGAAQRVEERIEESMHQGELPDEIENIIQNVRILDRPCTRRSGEESLICYPLRGGRDIQGYFLLRRERELSATEDATVRGVLEVFANFYDLLDSSQRDKLTGLLNRYSLELNLDRLWNLLHVQQRKPHKRSDDAVPTMRYWLGVIDVDHFKRINDQHGHLIGDEILVLVGRLLRAAFRQGDLIYRYGGEEFVAVIAAQDDATAASAFERARRKVEGFEFPKVGHVSISCGFSWADPSILPQEVLNRADCALYEAKAAGRNRVLQYENLIRLGVIQEAPVGSIDLF